MLGKPIVAGLRVSRFAVPGEVWPFDELKRALFGGVPFGGSAC